MTCCQEVLSFLNHPNYYQIWKKFSPISESNQMVRLVAVHFRPNWLSRSFIRWIARQHYCCQLSRSIIAKENIHQKWSWILKIIAVSSINGTIVLDSVLSLKDGDRKFACGMYAIFVLFGLMMLEWKEVIVSIPKNPVLFHSSWG